MSDEYSGCGSANPHLHLAALRKAAEGKYALDEADRWEIGQAADEIENLRALVTRLTDVAANLAAELSDPGTEALAAIHCGRNFIYG